eukprot:5646459-Prymnesium_polylepis.1
MSAVSGGGLGGIPLPTLTKGKRKGAEQHVESGLDTRSLVLSFAGFLVCCITYCRPLGRRPDTDDHKIIVQPDDDSLNKSAPGATPEHKPRTSSHARHQASQDRS